MQIDYTHRQSAHCENGVTAGLVSHHCVRMSEPLAFGIGAGIFYGYIPFMRLNNLPLATFRVITGAIFKRVTRELGIKTWSRSFRNPADSMRALDEALARGIPVGLQTGAWWLPYFPEAYRFHFNMHNLVVYGKEGGDYLISDPVFPEPVVCGGADLVKARYTKGTLAPKGRMYYLAEAPAEVDLAWAVRQGIRTAAKAMLKSPLPIIGVSGIRYLAKRLENWPQKLGPQKSLLYLGQMIRMQEEIGTGGAGFRFIYAAFLQEAAGILSDERFSEHSQEMTGIGDRWREFAVRAARNCKVRAGEADSFPAMAEILRDCASREEQLYRELAELVE